MSWVTALVQGLIFSAASDLHWAGRWRESPKVGEAAFQYLLWYNHERRGA